MISWRRFAFKGQLLRAYSKAICANVSQSGFGVKWCKRERDLFGTSFLSLAGRGWVIVRHPGGLVARLFRGHHPAAARVSHAGGTDLSRSAGAACGRALG